MLLLTAQGIVPATWIPAANLFYERANNIPQKLDLEQFLQLQTCSIVYQEFELAIDQLQTNREYHRENRAHLD